MTVTRPRAERGAFPPGTEHYGRSLLGAPLIWFPAPAANRESGLILAGTHGDETSSVVTLSCALRTLNPSLRRHHVVLAVNPDGCQLGLRANANGIDLNRNFPAANWKAGETVYRWNSRAQERDVVLLTGDHPGSEPETQALCQLIHRLQPAWVVSFHDPLACIEDPRRSELGEWLADAFALPLVTSVGYENARFVWQLVRRPQPALHYRRVSPVSADEASEKYLLAMSNLLRWHPKDGVDPS